MEEEGFLDSQENVSHMSHLELGFSNYNFYERFKNEDNKIKKKEKITINDRIYFERMQNLRIAIIPTFLLLVFLNSNFSFMFKEHNIACTIDTIHEFLTPINKYLTKNINIKIILQIITSLSADILFLIISTVWITQSLSYRFIISLIVYISFGILSNFLLEIKPSENNIWDFPGVPSLVVNYTNSSNSFLYPFDIGIIMICSFEFKKANCRFLSNVALITSIFLSFLKLACKSAYNPGVIMAYIIADLVYQVVEDNINIIDYSEIGIKHRKSVDSIENNTDKLEKLIN